MKTCTKCRAEKPATTEFFRYMKKDDRLLGSCLGCERAAAKERMARRPVEAKRASVKAWKSRNPEHKRDEDYRRRAKGTWKEGMTRAEAQAAIAKAKAVEALISTLNAFVMRETREPKFCWVWNKPGQSEAWKFRVRYQLDPEFTVRQRLRTSARRLIRRDRVGDLVRGAICRGGSSPKAEAMLGYPVSLLVTHLERQFSKGMSWTAFRDGRIHIDHIAPLSSFDLSQHDEWKAAWSLSNLRPLWAAENIKKRDSITHLL